MGLFIFPAKAGITASGLCYKKIPNYTEKATQRFFIGQPQQQHNTLRLTASR